MRTGAEKGFRSGQVCGGPAPAGGRAGRRRDATLGFRVSSSPKCLCGHSHLTSLSPAQIHADRAVFPQSSQLCGTWPGPCRSPPAPRPQWRTRRGRGPPRVAAHRGPWPHGLFSTFMAFVRVLLSRAALWGLVHAPSRRVATCACAHRHLCVCTPQWRHLAFKDESRLLVASSPGGRGASST